MDSDSRHSEFSAMNTDATVRQHAMLRFAAGVTAAFVLCEYLQWQPTFIAPALTAVLLANLPMRPSLKMGLVMIATMAGASLFAFALSALLRGTPTVLFGLIAVCIFLSFDAMQSGRSRLPAMLLLICLATIPVVVMVAPVFAENLPVALIRGIAVALLMIWGVCLLWPHSTAAKPAPAATAKPDAAAAQAMALISTAVVLPLMLVYLLFGITDAFPVIVNTVMLVANFNLQRSRAHALGLVLGNFAGGLLGLLIHRLLLTTPSLPFLALLLFLVLLWFGRRIAAGGHNAPVALIACNAMLINLGLAIALSPGSFSVWLTRLFQIGLAGAFAVGMLVLLWHRAAPRPRPNPI
jgi:DUF2955 family protein